MISSRLTAAGRILVLCGCVALQACATAVGRTEIPAYPSASGVLSQLAAGELSSEQLVVELLQRAENASALNAYITVAGDSALQQARSLDTQYRGGQSAGALHGLPIIIKDNIHVAGMPNTAGTPWLSEFVPAEDNAVVAALKNSGAVIMGKANMHELAFGITSVNAAFGAVANPWNTSTFAGGSSGGTASAVAAGLVPAGLGTDTGGSVRIPAALTGVVGFRPSTGRYDSSRVTPISHTRDTVGIIARNVRDAALLDNVIVAQQEPLPAVSASGLRLGIAKEYYYAGLDTQSAEVVHAALQKLSDAGVELVEVNPQGIAALLQRSAFPIALYEVYEDLPAYLQRFAIQQSVQGIAEVAAGADVKGVFQQLSTPEGRIPAAVYDDALAAREEMRALFRDYFADNRLDAMIFPTTLLPGRPIENSLQTVELNGAEVPTFPTYIHNTDSATIAGLPAISLPAALTRDGLPVGMELDGPEKSDRQLLAIARTVEGILGFSAQPPAAWAGQAALGREQATVSQ